MAGETSVTIPNMVFPSIWGKDGGVLSMRMQVILDSLDSSFARTGSALHGAGRKESSGTGLVLSLMNICFNISRDILYSVFYHFICKPYDVSLPNLHNNNNNNNNNNYYYYYYLIIIIKLLLLL